MGTTEEVLFLVLSGLSIVGVYFLTGLALGWWTRSRARSEDFDPWLRSVFSRIHRIIDLDVEQALEESRLMAEIGNVPPETAYRAVKRLDLGRRVERAILDRLEMHGIGKALPADPRPEETPDLEAFLEKRAE